MNGNELLDRIRPVEHRLENGLTLLVREDRSAPVVAIVTHVRAGYFDEPDRLVGISHVLEHMFFKGTERRGVGEIARDTKAAGGYLNAGTIYDHTSYYTVLPSSAVSMGLEIQADALINSQIDEAELRRELRVIIQEVKRKLDTPAALASEKLYEAMFDVHPMRRWRMGEEAALARLRRKDVFDYYRRMYRGGNTTLVVAGDVDPERVIERVESLYAALPGGAPEAVDVAEPDRRGARYRELAGDVQHAYAELGWRVPGALHPDTAALDALAVILGQGRASRLYRGVRDRGLASSIDAYNYTPRSVGVFGISAEADAAGLRTALQATTAEVDRLLERGVTAAEIDRVRVTLQARLLRRLETAEGQANLLAEWEALGDWRRAGVFVEEIRTLEPDRVDEVARSHLDPGDVTLLVYRPEDEPGLAWSDADLPAALRDGWSPGPARDSEDAPLDRAQTAPVKVAPIDVDDGVHRYDVEWGRLVVKPRTRAPLVSMAVVRPGGVLHESVEVAGITGLLMRASVRGTDRRSAGRIARESEALGGAISASAGADLHSWSLTVPAEHFDPGLELLADVAFRPSFPDGEVARERELLLSDLERLRDDMYRYPVRLLLSAAFEGHPYGRGIEEIAEAVSGIGPDGLRSWHGNAAGAPWIYVVGDVDPDRAAEAVATLPRPPSGGAPGGDRAAPWPGTPTTRSVRRDRSQTARAIAFPGPDRRDEDRVALQVLSNAISGLGNRLFEELRSRRSLAYTVHAHPLTRRHGGAFLGYIATSPDRADEARDGLLDMLLALRDEPLGREEVERARRYTVGAWQIRTQTNRAQLSQISNALMLGAGLDELRTFEDRIRAVTPERIMDVVRRWFDPERLVEGVVHGRTDADSG